MSDRAKPATRISMLLLLALLCPGPGTAEERGAALRTWTPEQLALCPTEATESQKATQWVREGRVPPDIGDIYGGRLNRCIEAKLQAQEQAKAQEAQEAAVQTIFDDPAAMRIVWSAVICRQQELRADALAKIKKEHRYARVGGVVRLESLYWLQRRVREADDAIAVARSWLEGRKPLPCSVDKVRALVSCLAMRGRVGEPRCSDADEVMVEATFGANETATERQKE